MASNSERSSVATAANLDLDDGRVILGQKSDPTTPSPTVTQSQPVQQSQSTQRDTSITKVNARYSPRGKRGQKYLAAGVKTSMRLWEDEIPGKPKSMTQRDYETVGFVIKGRAELEIEGQRVTLEPGDSWIVPKGAQHRYHILESFTAVEATCPPAEIHGRDEEE
jgi:mannose-6-phosphate isomerase-like protein (cupin superfamily)